MSIDEQKRLDALLSYEILDTPDEVEYSNIVSLAANILGVPDAFVTLLDSDRQWIKSALDASAVGDSPLDLSFCKLMIPTGEPLIIEDTMKHEVVRNYANVIGAPHIRFYAGVPLEAPEGGVLGALCVTDSVPRRISSDQMQALKILASQIQNLLELRRTSSQLQKALGEAMEARKARDLFFASVSHDIRTPAAAIVGASELLRRAQLPESEMKLVRGIESNGKTLTMLLNNLLDLAKMDAGRFELVESVFNLRALVREVYDGQLPIARSKDVDLSWSYDRSLGQTFRGDPLRIRQILSNLLSNAVKFTRHGTVRISVGGAPNGIRLTVSDSGIGIPSHRIDAIMREYEQAEESTQERYGGTGLGLSIVWRLTNLMQGHLEVSSELGKGSTFCVTLPLKEMHIGVGPGREVKKALVVDDDEVNRLVIEALLTQRKIEVNQASTARDARVLLNTVHYDLILMDERLPDGRGTDLSREARLGRNADSVILGISAAADDGHLATCLAAGMNGCLPKPFTIEQLETATTVAQEGAKAGSPLEA